MPVTVTVAVPVAAVDEAVSVRTLLVPVVVVVAGLKLAVTPVGKPLAVNETALANPFKRVMVIVLVPLDPWLTVRLAGLGDRLKSGVPPDPTVSVSVALWTSVPLVPVMLMGKVPEAVPG